MTTTLGIKTNVDDIDAIVLGSDTQVVYIDSQNNPYKKKLFYKIVAGDFWVLAQSGNITDELRRFYNKLSNPERFKDFNKTKVQDIILQAIEKKRFFEVNELNASLYRETQDFSESGIEFLLATNKPDLNLYHIDPFGNLIESENEPYLVLGSGHEEAIKYLDEKIDRETYDTGNINLERALMLSRRALKRAETDIFTGGPMDLVVVRKDTIHSYGKQIKRRIEESERSVFEEILKQELEATKNS